MCPPLSTHITSSQPTPNTSTKKERDDNPDKRTHLIISRIDQNLIYNLEETRDVLHIAKDHTFRVRVVGPYVLGDSFDGADVGIGTFEDVFELGELQYEIRRDRRFRTCVNDASSGFMMEGKERRETHLLIHLRRVLLLAVVRSRSSSWRRRTRAVIVIVIVNDHAIVRIVIHINERGFLLRCRLLHGSGFSGFRFRRSFRCGLSLHSQMSN